ncbi:MAG: ABC transporter ATP-binding protein [Candidatus Obscuribacterales bacterium]|jgi:ABC-2 type transport system ATP-binding protein|nr:ABC transporter ATP-binding protein [Candidatus Obscuribacterales bacterium]
MSDAVIQVDGLVKDHVSNFLRKRFRALDGLSFKVAKGETYGLLGPNGAGKTTIQKLLLGLIRPTAGEVTVLGEKPGSRDGLGRIGYLPENPYFYTYLTGQEFLEFFAVLAGVPATKRKERIDSLLELVSLKEIRQRPLRKFSKGMLQRIGIAQALISDPELVFLDEPNSGLDPIGRYDIRRIILELKAQGKTVFLNSHMLPDVREVCDRVGILHRGKLVAEDKIANICGAGGYQELEEYFMHTIEVAENEYRKAGSITPYHIERESNR